MEHTYKYDIDDYHFELFIGDDGYMWDDEGVLQPIKLSVNGHYVINNNWGRQHNLDFILNKTNSDSGMNNSWSTDEQYLFVHSQNKRIDIGIGDDPVLVIYGNVYNDFIKWIKSCLSPKPERIKIKLDQLLENKKREV
jgi:hypothetical protein